MIDQRRTNPLLQISSRRHRRLLCLLGPHTSSAGITCRWPLPNKVVRRLSKNYLPHIRTSFGLLQQVCLLRNH